MPFEFKANATSQSVEVPNGKGAVAIRFPATAMSGTAVAVHGSFDGTNFFPIYNDGVALSIPITASTMHVIRPGSVFGIPYLKLVSTAPETTSVNCHYAEIVK